MNKIFVVTGTRYTTDVEIWHTRTELFRSIVGIYSTKERADEVAEQMEQKRESNYFPDLIRVVEYQLDGETYFPRY